MNPRRIQLRRIKGWRKPPGAIVVARPSRWGNPDRVGDQVTLTTGDGFTIEVDLDAATAVALYRERMDVRLTQLPGDAGEDLAYVHEWRTALAELAGHDLACWCPLGQPCHADVLLELANRSPDVQEDRP